jgi:hypothetical protein
MVGYIMAHRYFICLFIGITAPAVSARQLISPGTLVFLGRAR